MQHKVMMKPITVVVITYNSSKTIIPLLKSLNVTDNLNIVGKIIIIENNSPDSIETIELVKRFQKISTFKIRIINSKVNSGFAKSCNIGASMAHTKYVLFINPDTTVAPKSLKILLNHAELNKTDIIGGISVKNKEEYHKTVVRNPNLLIGLFELTSLGKIFHIRKGHSDFYYEDIPQLYSSKSDFQADAIGGAYLMVKKKSFDLLGGFDTNFFMYLEDVDLGYRANMQNMKVYFCPHSKINHIGGASSKNKYRIRHQAWYDSRRYYYKKHHNLLINMILQPIFIIEEFVLKIRNYF